MTNERVYYVDSNDMPTGEVEDKLKAHNETTRLHAAFSCYVFSEKGQFLVTQRAHSKKVWHGVWTNSCCGHPGPGESRENAIKRRLKYELGMTVKDIKVVLPKYIYKTPPYNKIIEHEYCPVYLAIATSEPIPNPAEVEDYRWVDWEWYVNELEKDSTDYSHFAKKVPKADQLGKKHIPKWSWWCKDQYKQLETNEVLQSYLASMKTD